MERINVNSQIKFKTWMLRWTQCDNSDAYILASAIITISNTGTATNPNNKQKIIIKNCARCTKCMSEINKTKIDNAKDMDIAMLMYNLIEYSHNYSKIYRNLWQYPWK